MKASRRSMIRRTLAFAAIGSRPVAFLTLGSGAAATLVACGGGGSDGGPASSGTGPTGLSYSSPAHATVGSPIAALTPTETGAVTSYSVNPALPAGLSIDRATGVISGTPTVAAALATFTVTATNANGSTAFALLLTVTSIPTITSLSTATPTALTSLSISTLGVDTSQSFTVTLSDAAGASPQVLAPIRSKADGTVVVAMPLTFNATTGATTSFNGQLTVTQGTTTSAPVSVSVADIPQLSDYGMAVGEISRAFYMHQQLVAAGNLNVQQALAKVPGINLPASNLQSHLQTQLTSSILARSDVDRLMTGRSTSLSVGTAVDGTPVAFTNNSLAMQDRVIAMYLLASTRNGTAIASISRNSTHALRDDSRSRANGFTLSPGALRNVTTALSVAGSYVGIKTAQQTLAKTDSTELDDILATASLYQSRALIGTTIVALGAAAVGAPVVAAIAGGLLSYEVMLGLGIGAASIGNDLVNVATSGYKAYKANGDDAALNANFASAGAALVTDSVTTALSAWGVKAFAGTTAVTQSVFEGLWGTTVQSSDAAFAAVSFVAGVGNYYLQDYLDPDHAAVVAGLDALAALPQSAQTGLGTVSSTVIISNSQGPILSGLTGVEISDGSTTMSMLADPTGNADVLIPLGNPAINYANMTLSAYDPVTGTILGTEPLNLRTLTTTSGDTAPPVVASCTDDDAGDPDSDDPDCD